MEGHNLHLKFEALDVVEVSEWVEVVAHLAQQEEQVGLM